VWQPDSCSYFRGPNKLCLTDIDIRTADQRFSTQSCTKATMDLICPELSDFGELDDFFEEENLVDLDPFLEFIAASGEVNFEYPDSVVYPAISASAVNMAARTAGNAAAYNTARASRPLILMSIPHDVRNKIYAMSLGPPTEVVIESFTELPKVTKPITSPTKLFLVSRKVYREAAAVFYGRTTFHLQHEYGIGYMTGHMGLENCREIRHFTAFMHLVWNIPLTTRTVFPKLETLSVLPNDEWFHGPWYDHLHKKYSGFYQAAIEDAVITSQAKTGIGLRELMEMSRHYAVIISLPFWNNADTSHRPVVSISILQGIVCVANSA
jgi:hypothetical protein